MRLDAVFLVAPKPKPPVMPTRRAFFIAGVAFVAGTSLGGACGYAMGAKAAGGGGEEKVDEPLQSSGDADLDELRRLAVKAPIGELMGKATLFIDLLRDTYPKDPVLWKGAERICDEILSNDKLPSRRAVANWLAQVIEGGDAKLASGLKSRAPTLRRVK